MVVVGIFKQEGTFLKLFSALWEQWEESLLHVIA